MREDNPLVSIIVITYNSAKFVLETLESAKAQTYQNIELIVSDDCSTDNTVEICREWIEKNKMRFVQTVLITVPNNTGIPANCNRGVRSAQGNWVKLIAGDDVLMKHCIEYNHKVCIENNYDILQTNVEYYRNTFNKENFIGTSDIHNNVFYQNISSKEQLNMILYGNRVIAPSTFLKRKVFLEVGGFDEEIHLFEDLPFWTKILQHGYKINVNSVVTVKYRIHDWSAAKNGKKIMQQKYAVDLLKYSRKYKRGRVNSVHYFFYNAALILLVFMYKLGLLRKNDKIDKLFASFFARVMNLGKPNFRNLSNQ